jgi:hypothetical protein
MRKSLVIPQYTPQSRQRDAQQENKLCQQSNLFKPNLQIWKVLCDIPIPGARVAQHGCSDITPHCLFSRYIPSAGRAAETLCVPPTVGGGAQGGVSDAGFFDCGGAFYADVGGGVDRGVGLGGFVLREVA